MVVGACRPRTGQLSGQGESAVAAGQSAPNDRSLLDTVYDGLGYDQLSAQDRRFVDLQLAEAELGLAGSSGQLSTYWVNSGQSFSGDEVVFPQGYRAITDHLAQGLDVELGQTVNRIEVTGAGVEVTANGGVWTGDRAVVTLPLGVLKSGAVDFSPGLPAAMQAAVDGLGMGVLNKTYLRFPSRFWPASQDWFVQTASDFGEWTTWLNVERSSGQPILMGFNAGDFGRSLENWSDQQIVDAGMARLRSLFGAQIPDPTDFQITRWGSDAHTWGSYSFIPVDADPAMRDDLAGAIDDRVFFAGEATNRQYPSTVHGAYLSGLNAASRVDSASQIFSDGFESGDSSAWNTFP